MEDQFQKALDDTRRDELVFALLTIKKLRIIGIKSAAQ
jgi:hypothetical protein